MVKYCYIQTLTEVFLMKNYVGHPLQTRGAEQYIMQNSKGDGMHFIYVRNGLGLEAWISLDRCADLSRVIFKGYNYAFMSPCGYVAPSYYNIDGMAFLDSFTAGFFTTCGLSNVGGRCEENGTSYPMHGTISNIPAILTRMEDDCEGITIEATIREGVLFGKKMVLKRKYYFSYTENTIKVDDTVINESDFDAPLMILYHCNMGYPLLTEKSLVKIPNNSFSARDEEAQKYIENACEMEVPQDCFKERCYYYDVLEKNGTAKVGIYNGDINKGLVMAYEKSALPCFTEWKMMGKTDYVLGLEPGNCNPNGYVETKKNNSLKVLKPDEKENFSLEFTFIETKKAFEEI